MLNISLYYQIIKVEFMDKSKSLALLCAHVPHLDPRIEWMASSLSKQHTLKVFAYASYYPTGWDEYLKGAFLKEHRIYLDYDTIITTIQKINSEFLNRFFLESLADINILKTQNSLTFIERLKNLLQKKTTLTTVNQSNILTSILHKNILKRKTKLKKMLGINYYLVQHFVSSFYHLSKCQQFTNDKFDEIYCADLDSLLVGVIYKHNFGAKLIYDAHEIYWASRNNTNPAFEKFMLEYERALLPHVDKFITVSDPIEDYYLKHNACLTGKSITIPNAAPSTQQKNAHKFHEQNKLIFLLQGTLCQGRGIEEFIQAFRELQPENATFIIRGPISNAYKACLKRQAGELWDKSICYKTPVSEHQLIEVASEANIGLIPYPPTTLNQKYCSPNKLGQYMQAGLAIIAASSVFITKIINEAKCGVTYDYNNKENIKQQIRFFLNNPKKVRELQQAAKDYATTTYNWENFEKKLLPFLRETTQIKTPPQFSELA